MPNPYHDRTTQKLEFAKLYLNERKNCDDSGLISERAHKESFLFHLVGAKDSFLQEINYALTLGLPEHRVTEENLRTTLNKRGKNCQALDEIETLENDGGSWMNLATWFRNQGTHRANIRRLFRRGGEKESVSFTNPYTGQPMNQTITEFLSDCFEKMVELIPRLRATLP